MHKKEFLHISNEKFREGGATGADGTFEGVVHITNCFVGEGAAVGADVGQWRLRWADDICWVWHGCGEDEDYYRRGAILMRRMTDNAKLGTANGVGAMNEMGTGVEGKELKGLANDAPPTIIGWYDAPPA